MLFRSSSSLKKLPRVVTPRLRGMTKNRSATLATALLLGVTMVWGFTFVLNQQALEHISVINLQTWRFGLATFFMVALRPHWLISAPREHFVHGFWLGCALSAGYIVQLMGLRHTSATASGFITGLFVVLVPILTGLLFRQRVPTIVWVAVTMSTVGLGLIAFNGLSLGIGEALTLVCALMFALHVIGLDRWADPEYVYSLTTTQIGTVFLTSALATALKGDLTVPTGRDTWGSIIFLAVVATCVGYFAQTWVQSQLSSTRTAVILTMEPVFAGFAGVLVGNDQLTVRIVIGSLLILTATYVVELGPRHSAEGSHIHLEP